MSDVFTHSIVSSSRVWTPKARQTLVCGCMVSLKTWNELSYKGWWRRERLSTNLRFNSFARSSHRHIANAMIVVCFRTLIHLLHARCVIFEVRPHAQVSIFLLHVRLMCQSYARFGSISQDNSREACLRKFSIKVLWQVCDLEFSVKECHTYSQSTKMKWMTVFHHVHYITWCNDAMVLVSWPVRQLVVRKKSPSLHSEASVFVCTSNACSPTSSTAKTQRKRWCRHTEENVYITSTHWPMSVHTNAESMICLCCWPGPQRFTRLTDSICINKLSQYVPEYNCVAPFLSSGHSLGGWRRSSLWLFPGLGRLLDIQSLPIPGRVAHAAFAIQNQRWAPCLYWNSDRELPSGPDSHSTQKR